MIKYEKFKTEKLELRFTHLKYILSHLEEYAPIDTKQEKAMRKQMEEMRTALRMRAIRINKLIAEENE